MSEIKHDVSAKCGDSSNACADAKSRAVNPSDRTSLVVPIRLHSSSSTIAMTDACDKRLVHRLGRRNVDHVGPPSSLPRAGRPRNTYVGLCQDGSAKLMPSD